MSERKRVSLVLPQPEEDFGVCEWCGNAIRRESDIYKVRGDFVCRECVERMVEERED